METQEESVKLNVASCLTRVLSSEHYARKQAEEELKALEVTEGTLSKSSYLDVIYVCTYLPEFGVVLADMTASAESPVQYRQVDMLLCISNFFS